MSLENKFKEWDLFTQNTLIGRNNAKHLFQGEVQSWEEMPQAAGRLAHCAIRPGSVTGKDGSSSAMGQGQVMEEGMKDTFVNKCQFHSIDTKSGIQPKPSSIWSFHFFSENQTRCFYFLSTCGYYYQKIVIKNTIFRVKQNSVQSPDVAFAS